jgi:hypothetical protein
MPHSFPLAPGHRWRTAFYGLSFCTIVMTRCSCFFVVLFLVFPVINIHAQSAMDGVGSARAVALGRATTALPGDVGSQANPSAAAARSLRSIHFFTLQAYGLTELRRGGVDVVVPAFDGVLFGGAGTFGFDAYRENYFSFGAAYPFSLGTSRTVHVGLHTRYYHTSIPSYGQTGALGITVGSQVLLLPSLTFGVLAANVNAPQLGEGAELPQSLALGFAYQAAPSLLVVVDTVKDIDFPLTVRGGVEARLLPALTLRAGATSQPTRFTAGAGVHLGPLDADVAAEHHQALGWSPSVGFSVAW